jgi:nifR3 family TIM-barrel protein
MQPTFHVRDIPVYGDLILSPMDGYSDLPFRVICREYGSAMSYTEFTACEALLRNVPAALRQLSYAPSEKPQMSFQIFDANEDHIVAAAQKIESLAPGIIDLNMGCSVSGVSGRGAGAGLLRDPQKIGRIFYRMSSTLKVPVTGKIRLGWDAKTRNYIEVAKMLEDNGASLVAVHGRTREMAYKGEADWSAIAEVKNAVKIPVIGNGDVKTVADIARIKAQTGCDGVMIGRAAIGNPWIFQRKERSDVTMDDVIVLLKRHLQEMLDFYGDRGLILFRKHAVKYMFGMPHVAALRAQLVICESASAFHDIVGEFQRQMAMGFIPQPDPVPQGAEETADEEWSCDRATVACA